VLPRMLAHTFRGSTWRSVLGLESAHQVFRRYRTIRAREREYLREPQSTLAAPPGARLGLPDSRNAGGTA
jgi:hypothetical protein